MKSLLFNYANIQSNIINNRYNKNIAIQEIRNEPNDLFIPKDKESFKKEYNRNSKIIHSKNISIPFISKNTEINFYKIKKLNNNILFNTLIPNENTNLRIFEVKRRNTKSNEGVINYNLTEENTNERNYTLSYRDRKRKRIIKAFEDNNSIGKELVNAVFTERKNRSRMHNRTIFKTFDLEVRNSDINNINFFSYGKTLELNK